MSESGQATKRGRGKRLAVRALVVLGGAVAATAAAWLISSASAAADTLPDTGLATVGNAVSNPVPRPGTVTGTVTQLTTAVAHTALPGAPQPATPTLPTLAPPAAPVGAGWHAVTGGLSSAFGRLGAHLPGPTRLDPIGGSPLVPVLPSAPVLGRSLPLPAGPVVPTPTGAGGGPLGGVFGPVVSTAVRGAVPVGRPAAPLAPLPVPAQAPAGAPTGPTGSAAPGGPGLPEPAGAPVRPGHVRLTGIPAPAPLRRIVDEQQPGTTPD